MDEREYKEYVYYLDVMCSVCHRRRGQHYSGRCYSVDSNLLFYPTKYNITRKQAVENTFLYKTLQVILNKEYPQNKNEHFEYKEIKKWKKVWRKQHGRK